MPTRSPASGRRALVAWLALCLLVNACTIDPSGEPDASPGPSPGSTSGSPNADSSADQGDGGEGGDGGDSAGNTTGTGVDAGPGMTIPDPVYTPPPPPRREPLGCSGTPLSCSLRSNASCTRGAGCTLDGDCTGSPRSCYNQTYSSGCYNIDGCYWSGSSSSGSCAGSSRRCSLYSGFASCEGQPGCNWSEECTGVASSCETLSGIACENQDGCGSSCKSGMTACGGQCVDTQDDEANCGACGFACGPRSNCTKGVCECTAPAILCGGRCVDPRTDVQNCGVCGKTCDLGFSCNNRTCGDVNECASAPCLDGRACNNLPGSYSCGPCANGYAALGTTRCQEIDECATANGGCDPNAVCINDPGSFHCGACKTGYSGTSATGCVDVNECASNHGGCDPLATCTNLAGTYTCGSCPAGYTGSGATGCVDIDECQQNRGGCDPLASCTNLPGSRECGPCPSGYSGNGALGCVDVDECAVERGGCDSKAACINAPGTHQCGPCPAGYSGTGDTKCEDIDECATNHGDCDPLTACSNTPGSRTCGSCPSGYTGDGVTGCLPYLVSLSTSIGNLSPAFDPATVSYALPVPLLSGALKITAAAPQGSIVKINGALAVSGAPSADIPLTIASAGQRITIEVGQEGRAMRTYEVRVSRGAAMRSPLSIPGPVERVAMDGDTLVTGYSDLDNHTGVAKVYSIADGTVRLVATIPALDTVYAAGYPVALSGDRLAVGTGENVHVYERQNQSWNHAATIPGSGSGVQLEGDTLVTSANGFNVFHKDASGWRQEATLPACFRAKPLGGRIFTSCNDKAEVWDRNPDGTWRLTQTISQDPSGKAYVISDTASDGDTLVIVDRTASSPQPSSFDLVVYERAGADFVFRTRTRRAYGSPDQLSYSARVAVGGGMVALTQVTDTSTGTGLNPAGSVGSTRTGAIHLFTRESGWNQPAWLKAPILASTIFGNAVVMSSKYLVAISSPASAGAYIYSYTK